MARRVPTKQPSIASGEHRAEHVKAEVCNNRVVEGVARNLRTPGDISPQKQQWRCHGIAIVIGI